MAVIGREHLFKMFTMLRETPLWSVDPVYGAVQLLLDRMEDITEGHFRMLDSLGFRTGNLVVFNGLVVSLPMFFPTSSE